MDSRFGVGLLTCISINASLRGEIFLHVTGVVAWGRCRRARIFECFVFVAAWLWGDDDRGGGDGGCRLPRLYDAWSVFDGLRGGNTLRACCELKFEIRGIGLATSSSIILDISSSYKSTQTSQPLLPSHSTIPPR